jgi:hypothetical protein
MCLISRPLVIVNGPPRRRSSRQAPHHSQVPECPGEESPQEGSCST